MTQAILEDLPYQRQAVAAVVALFDGQVANSFERLTYLQALGKCRPVIVLDEPQEGMDTEAAVARLSQLDPLVKLRYFALVKTYQTDFKERVKG